jgi:prepilin-type N-terminal cleavage/methylation domain-containing protein
MRMIKTEQKGFTLIELLVALPIAALVVAAATGAVIQILDSTRASSYMVAYRQVQTAGYWVSHDALQAQEVMLDDPSTGVTEFLTLNWTDWDSGDEYRIAYTLEGMASGDLKYLQRQESVKGASTATSLIGEYIYVDTDPNEPTNCVWDGKVLTFAVKAQVGKQTASRTYEVKPRPFV